MNSVASRLSSSAPSMMDCSNGVSPELDTQTYRYWRIRTMYSMMIGYALFYVVRHNLSIAMPLIQADLGYSKIQMGAVLTLFSIIYGLGKGISGALGDRLNARYLMTFGLFMSALVNIGMGTSGDLTALLLFWGLNACFQSMGWPPCARLLTHWFTPRELGTKWALWNSSQQIGAAFIVVLGIYWIPAYGWRSFFWASAALGIAGSFFLFNRLRDTPESLGLPSVEEYKGMVVKKSADEDEDVRMSHRELLVKRVLKNPLVWYVSLANFFVYVVRMSVLSWGPTFLIEFKHSTIQQAGWQTAIYDVAGIVGGLVAGMLSDRLFKGYRGRVSALLMILLGGCVLMLWNAPEGATFWHVTAMALMGFVVTGPQILVGVAASDFASKRAAGAASGFTGTFGYLGTAFTGIGMGAIVQYGGWDSAFLCMTIAAFLSSVFFALTWNHRSKVLDQVDVSGES